ncbi:MAG: hypothetical protein EAZ70_08290 [Runella slithyformis]|nr:MAG: hypothetical protein EAZ70_08290 [Runella slithyformis]TAF47295.1 MAG: hypothetical protein EAZ63_07935 [Runella slithyformis]TAF82160.1 MAG: hypothetical protein EAZ50_04640 [Runella slithyformis]
MQIVKVAKIHRTNTNTSTSKNFRLNLAYFVFFILPCQTNKGDLLKDPKLMMNVNFVMKGGVVYKQK